MFWFHNNEVEHSAIKELSTLSDRAAAIVAAVLLENSIEEALKYFLLNHQRNASSSVHDDMFKNSGPLGSFSAKINLGYMLGLYTSGAWRDIDGIRDIRNDFAHDLTIQDFKSDSIRSRCNNIKWFTQHIHEHGA